MDAVDLDMLRTICGEDGVLVPPAGEPRYQSDWTGDFVGAAGAVLRPRTTAEVAALARFCHERRRPLVVQGGMTGLVGGAAPDASGEEIVVSLERMNRVRGLDPVNFTLAAEAGCILETLKDAATAADCLFPLALGAQGSCQIGGNIATNAGGLNVLRYGMTRDLVLGLEVVLPDGRVWDGMKGLRKNNAGYDLKQLFIGAEGTLGIVTAAVLKLFPRPSQVETALLAVPSPEHAMRLYARARRGCCDLMTAFELIPRLGLDLAFEVQPELPDPLAERHAHYVLLEVSGGEGIDLRGMVEQFLAGAAEAGLVLDGTLAASQAQAAGLWGIREAMNIAQRRRGLHLRTDVSVPISAVAGFIEGALDAVGRLAPDAAALAYGHVGDGNIHLNVLPAAGGEPEGVARLLHACEAAIFALADEAGGSISAEHGIGRAKRRAFGERTTPVHRAMLHGIKAMLDPHGIMAPGRLLPDAGLPDAGLPKAGLPNAGLFGAEAVRGH